MNRQQYANRIFRNQVTITEMQEQEYPALHRLLHERSDAKLKRLLFLLETALNMPNQEQGESGNWFIMPYSRLAQQGAHIAKTDVTWRKTITLFVAIGLIHRKIPTPETAKTPYEQKAVAYMIEQGNQHAASFYSFPPYTDRQLRYCERKACLWYSNGGNFQDWSKATVLDVFGSVTADRVYNDSRRKPRYKMDAENTLIGILSTLLETKRFTTRDELIRLAASSAANDQESAYNFRRLYELTWKRASKRILMKAYAMHKRPTDREKAEYGRVTNEWIIVRIE